MLFYMTSKQNSEIFDFLEKEHDVMVKKFVGEFHLKEFIIRDMRNFDHYSYMAIDLESLRDTENEILEAIIGYRTMYDSRIIILDIGRKNDELLIKLHDEGINDFISTNTIEDITKEILYSIKARDIDTKMELINDEDTKSKASTQCQFNCSGLKISVAGVARRVGTTACAFNLAQFLSSNGAKVSYLEANQNDHLASILPNYREIREDDNSENSKKIKFYSTKEKFNFSNFNFNILDIGTLSQKYLEVFKKSDIKILCATSKPYELNSLKSGLELVKDIETNCIFSFTSYRSRKDIREIVGNKDKKIYFSNYSPDLFNGIANKAIWISIISDYIFVDTKIL